MNGTLLYATRQYVACFVFLCFNENCLLDKNIQNVDTFHKHNFTAQCTCRSSCSGAACRNGSYILCTHTQPIVFQYVVIKGVFKTSADSLFTTSWQRPTYWKTVEISYLLPKNWVVRSSSNFAKAFTGTTPKAKKFRENLTTNFQEFFWNWNYFFTGSALQGVRMLRFYFWVHKGPNFTIKFEPPELQFWRHGVKGSAFPCSPQKLGEQIPSIFCTGYQGTLKVLWKSR